MFTHLKDSKVGRRRDKILDLDRADGLIDLSALDAKADFEIYAKLGENDFVL